LSTYADTSFLVSLYLSDSHSAEAQARMVSKPVLWLTPLHRAEWTHAVEQHIFQGHLSLREAQRVYADFDADRGAGVWVEVNLPELAFEVCAQLARRHVARLGGRTLDTLHVASALELKAERFWTFDARQAKLARAEGLKTDRYDLMDAWLNPPHN
jgi:predicted nucleic acid-binding protein